MIKKYKVDNAVIMAAGMSTRLAPLSYETPKALLNVHGEVLNRAAGSGNFGEAGIEEIFVVTGYKKNVFHLEEKFKVTLVENPYYGNKETIIPVCMLFGNI